MIRPAPRGTFGETTTPDRTAYGTPILLGEQHLQVRDMVREFARTEVAPVAKDLDRTSEFLWDNVARMGPLGLLGVPWPEELGGAAFLVVPAADRALRVRPSGGGASPGPVSERWRGMPDGYRVTLRVAWPEWARPHPGGTIGFDLLVNEMYETRVRRAGQLVWSGGNGWVYLRGDRQDPERLGVLELLG